jgi:hypothetical protein
MVRCGSISPLSRPPKSHLISFTICAARTRSAGRKGALGGGGQRPERVDGTQRIGGDPICSSIYMRHRAVPAKSSFRTPSSSASPRPGDLTSDRHHCCAPPWRDLAVYHRAILLSQANNTVWAITLLLPIQIYSFLISWCCEMHSVCHTNCKFAKTTTVL